VRQGKLIKGQWRDRFVYAILAHEFDRSGQRA
jgi:RimJ/RimL family protein N-acetyltransferase